jgi:uncharacterized Zn-finger protein
MSRPGFEPGPPAWEVSTLEKSHPDSLLIAIRNIYTWARDRFILNLKFRAKGNASEDKSSSCEQCAKSFSSSWHLHYHMKVHSGEKPYSCSQCSNSFAHSFNLKNHLRVHTGEKLFCCSNCTKSFAQSGSLLRHLWVHTGEKPYSCSMCSKSFALFGTLQSHLKFSLVRI